MMNIANAASVCGAGKLFSVLALRAGLAGLAFAAALGPAAGGTVSKPMTCQDLEQRCLAHAGKHKPRPPGAAAPKLPEDAPLTGEICEANYAKALKTGLWPGHHGSPDFRCAK
jgi:hypothetical protein